MDDRADLLEALLAVLLEQEATLGRLVGLALDEQRALVHSDYAAVERVAGELQAAANLLDAHERRRDALIAALGNPETLGDLVPLAEQDGVAGFAEARLRLMSSASALRAAQEQNARLIIDAVRLRERWYGLLAGIASPTYGARGRQDLGPGRGLISRSA